MIMAFKKLLSLFILPFFVAVSVNAANVGNSSAVRQMRSIAQESTGQSIDDLLSELEIPGISAPEDVLNEEGLESAKGAIILTVPGIRASSIWSYIFGRTNKDGVPIPQNEDGKLSENDKWLKDYFEMPTNESYNEFKEQVLEMAEEQSRYSEDDYLERTVRNLIPDFEKRNIYVDTYKWSRNALDSEEAMPGLIKKIEELSEKAIHEDKPLYIWSHSWGSVLTHTALHRLDKEHQNLTVATWITCGSPLVPSNKIVKAFASYMIARGGLEKTVAKPKNVMRWVNVWGKHDMISNKIRQCPTNLEMDNDAKAYEDSISFWSIHGIPDWIRMKNPLPWHSSYHEDFDTVLKSVKKEVHIPVFAPYIQPELVR